MKPYNLIKKTGLFFICCHIALTALGQSDQIINPGGGASSLLNDGLKIRVKTNGNLDVYRENKTQYYSGLTWPSNNQTGGVRLVFRFSQGSTYNINERTFTVCATTPVEQNGNDWTTSVTGYVTSPISNQQFYVTINFYYTHPNTFFYVDYWVRAPHASSYTTAETVHLYLDHDAFILGSDASKGCRIVNPTGELVGDYRLITDVASSCANNRAKNMRSPSHHGFKTGGSFRSYYTGAYANRNNINATNMLSNTIGTTCVDDGIAVEFTIGPLNRGEMGVRRIMHGYGDSLGEFDAIPVVDPIVPSGSSSPVTVNFTSSSYSEIEGDIPHPASTIQITVGGGILAQDQVCNFTATNGTAIQNTDYTYVKGFIIPAGNYTTPQTLTLNNFTIIGNTLCQSNRAFNISIDSDICNDLIVRGANNTATVTIVEDDFPTVITTHPSTATPAMCVNTGDFSALSVVATGTNLTYQWYRNTTASNSGGTLISGATNASYSPTTTALMPGDYYYYFIVTGNCGPATSNVSGKHSIMPPVIPSVNISITIN